MARVESWFIVRVNKLPSIDWQVVRDGTDLLGILPAQQANLLSCFNIVYQLLEHTFISSKYNLLSILMISKSY